MKVRQVTYPASGIQLLCASLLIHSCFVGAAPQGLFNFTPDSQKIFNDLPGQSGHSGLVQPAVQLKGPNFISAPEPVLAISKPQEPKISISQPLESIQTISQGPQPTISISQPFETPLPISQHNENIISISQPNEPTISISQPLEPNTFFSQPQFTNRNSLSSISPNPQNFFVNHQLPANDFINSQQFTSGGQQPDFVFRSQPSVIPFQQQNQFNSQPFLIPAIQESVAVIRDTEPILLPQQSFNRQINTVESFNEINNVGGSFTSTGGESPLVSLFPEDKVVEVPIPFLRNSESISVGPVTTNTFTQNQPQTTFMDSSAKNLDTINSVDTQADNFSTRQGLNNLENTFEGNIGTGDFTVVVPSEGSNNNGIPLSSVVTTIQGDNNSGVPISSTNNVEVSTSVLSNTATVSVDNNIGVPLTSTVNIASEDNTLSSAQNPTNNADINLMALISSALNADTNLGSSIISATDANTGADFGSQTLGEVLLSLNGQDGIVVLPMDSNGASAASELLGGNDNQNITFRADEGSSDGDLGNLLEAFVSDYVGDDFELPPPAPPSPPNLFRSTLSDTLFVKGQWLGTLLGGLIDIGEAVTGQLRKLKSKN